MPYKDLEIRKQYQKKKHRKRAQEIKKKVITYYGGGLLSCVKCGFSDIQALCIDHLNGGGRKEKSDRANGSSDGFYRYLVKADFPSGYQTLCANCNLIKMAEQREYGWNKRS